MMAICQAIDEIRDRQNPIFGDALAQNLATCQLDFRVY
jgi:hypothetical protein